MQHLFDSMIFTFLKTLCVAPTGVIAQIARAATLLENGVYDQC
jgi:hypothetical protein